MVDLRTVANAQNEWVALSLRADSGATLQTLFGTTDLLAAIAPLDCIVQFDDPAILTQNLLAVLPPNRVLLAVPVQALAQDDAARHMTELQAGGYRVLVDGVAPPGVTLPPALRRLARDCSADAPPPGSLASLFGPHLAYGVATHARLRACEVAGFGWFSGDWVTEHRPADAQFETDDGTSRRRLLAMLALLARDADSCEIEDQLKQDPGLCYHLLKLVNSAAFSCGTPITSFGQAITRIGRRQLQRWLQLLLYAHQAPDGQPNLLLLVAALRGALLEALARRDGLDRNAQDLAFMCGVFSLLDRLFHMPMPEVVRGLGLVAQVEDALLRRSGLLGRRLRLAEAGSVDAALMDEARVDPAGWWQDQLHAHHWAIQVARNV
ncbi:HDOD domain-containing protein [Massilia sp. 9096]|uniref:HDOD domain-containing protein n=1 Tax=Massilia sp. 9096 TaxID=1500894 RepID=UPI001EFB52DC|nr:HDOD domain-containing protein [Massilia sp. 9096]